MRVLIADDHPVVRHGLKQLLAGVSFVNVVGEAASGDEALQLARALEWDVAILDFTMPGRSGLELVADMKREFPGRPILVLSMHAEDVHGTRALRSGASGYITKESVAQELTKALTKVASGGKYVSASLAELLVAEHGGDAAQAPHERLSDREYRIMWLLATGRRIKEAASELGISPSTASTYRTRILKKLGFGSSAELVRYAVRHQLTQ